MDPRRNPYVPTAGAQPPELAGRSSFLIQAEIALDRALAGRYAKSFIAVGLRGVGKTVLLNRVAQLAERRSFRYAMIEAHEDKRLATLLAPQLRRMTLELSRLGPLTGPMKRLGGVLKSFISSIKVTVGDIELGVEVPPETGSADSGDLEADLPEMFLALGKAAQDRGSGIAIIIDELQYMEERELSALIMALHRTSQSSLPVVLVAAGLPQLVGKIGKSKSYAERLFDFPPIGPLDPPDAQRALAEPAREQGVDYAEEALARILALTKGYPFFLQEWGSQAWNVADASPITPAIVDQATERAIESLDRSFFRVRLDRLTPVQKRYMRAMAELGPGPHRSGDIAAMLGRKVTAVGPLRGELIAKGMIYSPSHGDTAFTVPLFDEFMRRAMPYEPG
ncbi:MAG: ATP-binding protein [Roseomonas sp.]|nr:ATP-binding protein [Roseomonas sp.]